MKISNTFFIISVVIIAMNLNSIHAQVTIPNEYIPGTICKDKECSNVDKSSERGSPNQIQSGNGTIATSYTVSGCGINFVQTTVRLNQRSFGGVTPPTGATQPAAITVAGLPTCFTSTNLTKAFLYCGGSGNGVAISANITNTANVTQTFPMAIIGQHTDKCWGYVGTYNYMADVSSIINGNGSYTLSGLPANTGTNDMDGATLFIIYRDKTQTYTGHFIIADGCIEGSGIGSWVINGFNVCGATNSQTNFAIVSDLQQIADVPMKMNSAVDNYTLFIAGQQVWNYMASGPAAATSGQTSATFGITTGGDCWNFAVAGMYYRTACSVCTASACVVLPIELSKFEAACENNTATVKWETSTEKNNASFSILRSDDGTNFNPIAVVPGSGNSKATKQYSYIDNTVTPGKTYYYKLNQTDYNKTENTVGNVFYAHCKKKNYQLDIFPNPSSSEIYIVSENDLNNATLEILNNMGQKVKTISNVNISMNERFTIDLSDIINGSYQLIITSNETVTQKKLLRYK